MRALHHFTCEGIASHRAWLRSIARNICIDLLRERKRAGHEHTDFTEADRLENEPWVVDPGTPETVCLDRERRLLLRRAVAHLPPSSSGLLHLHYFEEMRCVDIARLTGMSEANVRRRITEALQVIRSQLWYAPRHPPHRQEPRPRDDRQVFGVALPRRIEAMRQVRAVTADGRDTDVDLCLTYEPRRLSRRTLSRLGEYIAHHPAGWRKRLEHARALRERGELAPAAAEYEALLARRPAHVAAWLELGETMGVLSGAAASAAVYERGMKSVTGEAVELLGALLEAALGRRAEALARIDALRTSSAVSYAGFVAARIALEAGLFDRACDVLEHALRLDPLNGTLRTMHYDALALAGREEEALAALQAAAAAEPLNLCALQRLFLRAVAPARGRVSLRRLLEIGRGTIETQFVHGVQACMQGSTKRALAIAAALVRDRPRSGLSWLRCAEIRHLCNSFADEDALGRACELQGADPRPRVLLANALAERGRYEDAARLASTAAELGPLAPITIVRLAERAGWSAAVVAAAAARVQAANPSMNAAALGQGRLPC
jgi:RNA polymerase sigma-70 factor (ECF subfamily)